MRYVLIGIGIVLSVAIFSGLVVILALGMLWIAKHFSTPWNWIVDIILGTITLGSGVGYAFHEEIAYFMEVK